MLRFLPQEILLLLLQYLDYETKVELVSCCSQWYQNWMKRMIRTFIFRNLKEDRFEELVVKAKELFSNPFHQIGVSFNESLKLIPFIASLNFELAKLNCFEVQFFEIIAATPMLRVCDLSIILIGNFTVQELRDSLSKVTNCELLSLRFQDPNASNQIELPYLNDLKSLSFISTIIHAGMETSIIDYARTLHHLCLEKCTISDVSMLGAIPYLELKSCNNISDISGLHHNNHVVIEKCEQITDYSHCFTMSHKIEIVLKSREGIYEFDLTKWRQVEYLRLITITATKILFPPDCESLPHTVKKCRFGGSFVETIDFTVTSQHCLHEIKLSFDNSITSFIGYGLENVAIVECSVLKSLRSVEGLKGERRCGKNRKVILSNCHNIIDFSPLQDIPIVEIRNCEGFTNPWYLQSVRDLTLLPTERFSFRSDIIPSPSYVQIQSLVLIDMMSLIDLQGIEKIPFLQMDFNGFYRMKSFLEAGCQLNNQRIVLCFGTPKFCREEIIELHQQFLQKDYDYYDRLPRRWIWTRKKKEEFS